MNMLTKTLLLTGGLALGMIACSNIASAEPTMTPVEPGVEHVDNSIPEIRGSTLQEVVDSTYKMNMNGYIMGVAARAPMCSAVAISPTQLVTAAHCVPKNMDISVVIETMNENFEIISEDIRRVKAVRTDRNDDTAFLELLDKSKTFDKYVVIATEVSLEMGDVLSAVGYPRVADITLTEGLYTGTVPLPGDTSKKKSLFYKATVPVTGGSSGGGLYQRTYDLVHDTFRYELIGLTTAGFRDVSFQNYFSTHENLLKVIKNLIDIPSEDVEANEVPQEGSAAVKDKYIEAWKDLER